VGAQGGKEGLEASSRTAVDIRTKLVFALVAVALASMSALGGVMYNRADQLLRESTRVQLDGLAEARKDALEDLLSGWRERVQLIASRTQLRMSLREYTLSPQPRAADRIRRILADAMESVVTVESLTVYDLDGEVVASVQRDSGERAEPPGPPSVADEAQPTFVGTSFSPLGRPEVEFASTLALDGERLGTLAVRLSGEELVALTRNFTGLRETGEVLIVMRDPQGDVQALHPVRHIKSGAPTFDRPDDPAIRALEGEPPRYMEGIDYRGERVRAATRYLPEVRWGLVVKFDAEEEEAPINEFRREMTRLGLSFAAFAILGGAVLGIRFATPIHDLAKVANRIKGGELNARVKVASEDEIGLLSRTFNQMADELEERLTLLHEFHTFFELSPDMLCIAGTDGYFKRTNPCFERTLGWSTDELLSRPFFDLVHPDDLEVTVNEIDKLARGIPTISFVNRFRCEDGTYKYLRWTAHPEPDTGLLYAVAREIPGPDTA
jgi:PAS domain S-box-containing protein